MGIQLRLTQILSLLTIFFTFIALSEGRVISSTQAKCYQVSDYKTCDGKHGHESNPRFSIPGTSFQKHVAMDAGLCGKQTTERHFHLVDGRGTEWTYYIDKEGQLCREILVIDPNIRKLQNITNKVLHEETKGLCGDYLDCAENLKKLTLQQIRKVKGTGLSEKIGRCKKGECPEDLAIKKCEKSMDEYYQVQCPGGRAIKKAKLLKEIFTYMRPDGSVKKSPPEGLGKKILEACHLVASKDECLWKLSDRSAEALKRLYPEYQRLFEGVEERKNDLRNLISFMGVERPTKECGASLFECSFIVQGLRPNLFERSFRQKVCGKELQGNDNPLIGNKARLVHPLSLQSKIGETVGSLQVEGNTLIISSKPTSKGQMRIKFSATGRQISSHRSSTSEANGSFFIENKACSNQACRYYKMGHRFSLTGQKITYTSRDRCPASGSVAVSPYSGESQPAATGRRHLGPADR